MKSTVHSQTTFGKEYNIVKVYLCDAEVEMRWKKDYILVLKDVYFRVKIDFTIKKIMYPKKPGGSERLFLGTFQDQLK